MASEHLITQNDLKEFLHYDPVTGAFTWAKTVNSSAKKGNTAGSVGEKGFIHICMKANGVKRVNYKAHRLAWLYVYGYMPPMIDHKNGIRSDNRLNNLRECNVTENQRNQKKRIGGSSRFKGVRWDKRRKVWVAAITVDYRTEYLGRFNNEEQAARAYDTAARERFGEFARPNFPEQV